MCVDPSFPYCDADGSVSGTQGVCIAVDCVPGEILRCLGDEALTCAATGKGYERQACELGCGSTPTPHCKLIEPRYLPDICTTPASGSLVLDTSGTFDPNLDVNCTGGIVVQTGAADICVVRYGAISIGADARITIPGRWDPPGRSVAFVADENLSIDGTVDVSAHNQDNGPGAALDSSGGAIVNTGGGAPGGAGGRTAGGPGATKTVDGGANNGGPAIADPSTLAVFQGGAPAHKPRGSSAMTNSGGGGGALMLVSCRGTVDIAGTISAGGGGGLGGQWVFVTVNVPLPGLGGGAGGYVVLQGVDVKITGRMFANGGSGGNGARADQLPGMNGPDGVLTTTPAAAGVSANGEGVGGRGGTITVTPRAGTKPSDANAATGAGGGSMGFFQSYTAPGHQPTITTTELSPAFQPNVELKLR